MPLVLRYLAHSEIGLVRKNNQDSAYVSPTMLMVADGMGGAAAGDLASAVAIRELKAADGAHSGPEMLEVIRGAIERAADAMSELIDADPRLDGMGSTVCGLMFDGTQLALANIGDSRAYRFRDGELSRLTRDHSWVQTLVDEGRITEAEALEHPHRSLILKVINGQPQHQPDLELTDTRAGDRLLICSDGLCGLVTDAAIAANLAGGREKVMADLIDLAHRAGGHDNITVILADVVEGEPDGPTQVLGAASQLDLDSPETTARVPMILDEAGAPVPASKEQLRYAPVAKRRAWTRVTVVLAVLIPLLLLAGGGGLWYGYTQQQYFLGAAADQVAIFQGVPEPVFNLPLSRVVQTDTTRVADLPPYYQERVRKTIPAGSLVVAQATLDTLRLKAAQCIAQRQAHPTASPTPSLSATATPTTPSPTADPPARTDC
ncbi:MAG: protein phosphatase 2C domain-containing protein [Propionicimonas sp.]